MAANETDELSVFHIGKRTGYYVHWEPIYIGTHADPHYDERLSWEGKSDKMTQVSRVKMKTRIHSEESVANSMCSFLGIRAVRAGLRVPHTGQCVPRAQAWH